ncbi:MAG: chorismate synthase [Oscillospiraceae bacterium]|nr:chorismate synthase [Oscillospiraceae bacterium]
MNTFGEIIKISIFGESHGPAIGVVIDGLPPGFAPDPDEIAREMARRAPGQSDLATPRAEADAVEIYSGLFEGKTTGAPLCGMIRNRDTRSRDYQKNLARPGHADYTAHVKYKGFADYRGGGHFSGRLTAALCFAGALAKQLLPGVRITAQPLLIGGQPPRDETILSAKADGDSVGGVISCVAQPLPAGLGEPFFSSVESHLSALLFSIPAVKAVEFDDGFALADMRGSQSNLTDFGILGGITTGKPLRFCVAIKPTPSISIEQDTIDLSTNLPAKITVSGRHDPCIVPRAVPVVEAAAAIALLDLWLMAKLPLNN